MDIYAGTTIHSYKAYTHTYIYIYRYIYMYVAMYGLLWLYIYVVVGADTQSCDMYTAAYTYMWIHMDICYYEFNLNIGPVLSTTEVL